MPNIDRNVFANPKKARMAPVRIEHSNRKVIKEFLKKLTYKPGWEFAEGPWPGGYSNDIALAIKVITTDSTGRYNPGPVLCTRCQLDDERSETVFRVGVEPEHRYLSQDRRRREPFYVVHSIVVPQYEMSWAEVERWVLDQIIKVETHEAMEFFKVDGEATYFPDHSDPYNVQRADERPTATPSHITSDEFERHVGKFEYTGTVTKTTTKNILK